MATVDSLLPRVVVHAYNAPANFVRQAIIDSAREFCRDSRYWREDLTAEDTVVDQSIYPLTLPTDSEVVDFNDVYFSTKRRLKPKTMRQLDNINEQWRTQTGEPYYYLREGNASVKLVYIPQAVETGAIQVNAILQPSLTATTIDDKVLADYQPYELSKGVDAQLLALIKEIEARPLELYMDAEGISGGSVNITGTEISLEKN